MDQENSFTVNLIAEIKGVNPNVARMIVFHNKNSEFIKRIEQQELRWRNFVKKEWGGK